MAVGYSKRPSKSNSNILIMFFSSIKINRIFLPLFWYFGVLMYGKSKCITAPSSKHTPLFSQNRTFPPNIGICGPRGTKYGYGEFLNLRTENACVSGALIFRSASLRLQSIVNCFYILQVTSRNRNSTLDCDTEHRKYFQRNPTIDILEYEIFFNISVGTLYLILQRSQRCILVL